MTIKELIAQLQEKIKDDPQMYGEIRVFIRPDFDGPSFQTVDEVDSDEGDFVIYCS